MKFIITAAITVFSLSSFASNCSDINNLSQKYECVIENNSSFINEISHDKPFVALMDQWRGCDYPMKQVSLKTTGMGCSEFTPCLLLSLTGVPRAQSSNATYQNVRLEGFKLKFQPYRLSCD